MADLQQLIQEMVETKTFSLEAVKAIQQLRADHEIALTKINNLESQLKTEKTQNADLLQTNSRQHNELTAWQGREANLSKRENEMTRLEITTEFTRKMQENTLQMFNTVFANAVLKTSVMREVATPVHYASSSNGSSSTSVQKDKLVEDTTKEVD